MRKWLASGVPRARSVQNGFALVIVLWSMALLALLGAQLTSSGRAQIRTAAMLRDDAIAEAAADGAVRQAMFELGAGRRIGAVGRPSRIRIGESVVDIVAEDEAARINPNATSMEILRGLLAAIGVDQARAAMLAGEIIDWRRRTSGSVLGGSKIDQYRARKLPYRSGDRPFESIEELGLVADMTPDILARLRPWLSVWHQGDVQDRSFETPVGSVLADLSVSRAGVAGPGYVSHDQIMRVSAVAVVRGRARFIRSAVVKIHAEASNGAAMFQILNLE